MHPPLRQNYIFPKKQDGRWHWPRSSAPVNKKSVFSFFLRQLTTWHCSRLLLSAVLLRYRAAPTVHRYILPDGPTAANPLQRRVAADWWDIHTDRRTPLRTVTETMSHTRRAVSENLQRLREYGINTAWHNCIARLVTVPVEWCSVLYGAGHPDTAVNHYIDQLQLIDFRRVISGQNAPSEVVPNVSVRGRPHDGQAHCVHPPRH